MIYETRKYTVANGRMGELVKRFEKDTLRLFEKYNLKPVIFGISRDNKNEFFYVLKFNNEEEMKKSWDDFIKDKERIEIWDKSNENGKLVENIESGVIKSVIFKK